MTGGLLVGGLAALLTATIALLGMLATAPAAAPETSVAATSMDAPARQSALSPAQTTSVLVRPAPRPGQPAPAPLPVPAVEPPTTHLVTDRVAPKEPRLSGAVPPAVRRWEPLIVRYAAQYGLDPHLLAALMQVESGGRPDAVSSMNAVGLMQILHGPSDPETNVSQGAAILASHLRAFGDLDLALAAYNAGPNAVRAHGGVPPYDETRWHVYLTRWWYWAFSRV